MSRARKYLRTALRLIISGALLYVVMINIDLTSLLALIRKSNFLLLFFAMLLFILSKIISAYRLNAFQQAGKIFLKDTVNLKLYWLGMYYNLFLPGGIGGDGYKIYYLKKHRKISLRKTVLVLLTDRTTGVITLVIIILIFALFVPDLNINRFVLLSTAVFILAGLYYLVKKKFRGYYRYLNRTNLQSLGVHIFQMICALLILYALGEDQRLFTYLWVFLVSSLAALMPLTIGGIGLREMTFLYAARWLHLDVNVSLSLSLLFFIITALISLAAFPLSIHSQWIEGRRETL